MPSVDGVNYPGPWEVRLQYETVTAIGTRQHQLRMSVDVDSDPGPGSDPADYDLVSRAGLYYTLETWMDAFAAVMADIYHSNSTILGYEFWKYASGTFNAAYQTSGTLSVAGTSGNPAVSWSQAISTFRSQNGGSARLNFMESIRTQGVTLAYPTGIADADAIFDLIVSTQSPVLARDGGYLFAPLNWLVGQNEALFKSDYRP